MALLSSKFCYLLILRISYKTNEFLWNCSLGERKNKKDQLCNLKNYIHACLTQGVIVHCKLNGAKTFLVTTILGPSEGLKIFKIWGGLGSNKRFFVELGSALNCTKIRWGGGKLPPWFPQLCIHTLFFGESSFGYPLYFISIRRSRPLIMQ